MLALLVQLVVLCVLLVWVYKQAPGPFMTWVWRIAIYFMINLVFFTFIFYQIAKKDAGL